MADDSENKGDANQLHRGRIQAQGGGTEKSVSWAQSKPPTKSEMLEKCNLLEAQLTSQEREDRKEALASLRRCLESAAHTGGFSTPPPHSKRFPKRGTIRIDLEIFTGQACVPDPD